MSTFLLRMLAGGEWGRAMLAELAAIDERRARRRFARGCVRALLTRPAAWLRLAMFALVAAVPALLCSGPGHGADGTGLVVVGVVTVTCLIAVAHADPSASALAGGLPWGAGPPLSAPGPAPPGWGPARG